MRRFWLNGVTALLVLLLIITAGAFALASATRHSSPLKQALAGGRFYAVVADSIRGQLQAGDIADTTAGSAALRSAVNETITPSYVRRKVEPAIDASFQWLTGKTAQPHFTIDYSDARQRIEQRLTTTAASQVQALPDCTPPQQAAALQAVQSGDLRLTCVPSIVSRQLLQDLARSAVHNQFAAASLPASRYTAADIRLQDNRPFYDTLSALPVMYRLIQWLPWVTLALSLLVVALVWRLARDRQKTLLRLGVGLACAGLVVATVSPIVPGIGTRLAHAVVAAHPPSGTIANEVSSALQRLLAGQVAGLRFAGVSLIIAGAILLILLQYWRRSARSAVRAGRTAGS